MSVVVSTADKATEDIIYASEWNQIISDIVAVEESCPPIGSVIIWAGDSGALPDGYLLCNGDAISRATYSDLFGILSTTFGAGNGTTTFNIPDLRDKFVVGAGNTYSRNASGGNVTVNIQHSHSIPSHSHSIGTHYHTDGNLIAEIDFTTAGIYYNNVSPASFTSDLLNSNTGTDTASSSGRGQAVKVSGNTDSGGSGNTGNYSGTSGNGGSTALNILPPYRGMFYVIKAIAP